MTADNQVTLDDFMCRVPENGVVAIPADLYAKVCDALKLPAINSGGEVERAAQAYLDANETADRQRNVQAYFAVREAENALRAALAAMDRAPGVDDSRPDFVGSPQAKIEAYNQMHETAVELGYPSILEALEALEDLSQPEPRPVEAGEVIPKQIPPALHAPSFNDREELRVCINGCLFLRADYRQQSLSAARAEIEGLREQVRQMNIELYGVPAPEGAKPVSIFDLAKRNSALSTDQGREGE